MEVGTTPPRQGCLGTQAGEVYWPLTGWAGVGPHAEVTTNMAYVREFYSINEGQKPANKRVHHNNGNCPPGRDIPVWERRQGTGTYRLCDDCESLNR